MTNLYERVSISPDELRAAVDEVQRKWPAARLHKNDVTKNLSVLVDGELVGMLDLLDASVWDYSAQEEP